MQDYMLNRTGLTALRFSGELIAESEGCRYGGRDRNRWHDLYVFQTRGGKYVASITYRTIWEGELGRDFAEVFASAAEAARFLVAHDCLAYVSGYPTGDAYREKQERLRADLRSRYETQVSEVLASEEFTERVE